jgi:hypothetical protein
MTLSAEAKPSGVAWLSKCASLVAGSLDRPYFARSISIYEGAPPTAYADGWERRFPIQDKSATWHSYCAALVNDPGADVKHKIASAGKVFGLEAEFARLDKLHAAKTAVKKVASVPQFPDIPLYATDRDRSLPINNSANIVKAAHAFADKLVRQKYTPTEQVEICRRILKNAGYFHTAAILPQVVIKTAEARTLDPELFTFEISRRERGAPEQFKPVYAELKTAAAEEVCLDEDALLKLANVLDEADRASGLSASWGRELSWPVNAVMSGVTKEAAIEELGSFAPLCGTPVPFAALGKIPHNRLINEFSASDWPTLKNLFEAAGDPIKVAQASAELPEVSQRRLLKMAEEHDI